MVWGGTVSEETHAWFDKSFKEKRRLTKGTKKAEVKIAAKLAVGRKLGGQTTCQHLGPVGGKVCWRCSAGLTSAGSTRTLLKWGASDNGHFWHVTVCLFSQCPASPGLKCFSDLLVRFMGPLRPAQDVSDPVLTLSWTESSGVSPHLSGPDHRVCKTKGSRTPKTPRLFMKESPGALSKERNPAALGLLKQGLKQQQFVFGICFMSSGKLGGFHHLISVKSFYYWLHSTIQLSHGNKLKISKATASLFDGLGSLQVSFTRQGSVAFHGKRAGERINALTPGYSLKCKI